MSFVSTRRPPLPDPDELEARYGALPAGALVATLCRDAFRGRIAVVTSFGAESAVLLDLIARAEPSTPVIFLDTGKHFAETLAYRDLAIGRFRLSDVRSIRPDPALLAEFDPDGQLWQRDPDLCCRVRKVMPLRDALTGIDVVITGRKRHHGGDRQAIPVFESFQGRVRANPLADWGPAELDNAFASLGLPRNALVDRGYASIGCAPCTAPVPAGGAVRDGRWRGTGKTECGIHLPVDTGSHDPRP